MLQVRIRCVSNHQYNDFNGTLEWNYGLVMQLWPTFANTSTQTDFNSDSDSFQRKCSDTASKSEVLVGAFYSYSLVGAAHQNYDFIVDSDAMQMFGRLTWTTVVD